MLVQARTLGADLPDLPSMRALVRRSHPVRRFVPTLHLPWEPAAARLFGR